MTNLEIAKQIMENDFKDIEYPDFNWVDGMMPTPTETIKNKVGHCWHQADLAHFLFTKAGIPHKMYFAITNPGKPNEPWNDPNHTFLVFESDNKFYWFEHSYERFQGIHEYDSLDLLLADVRKKMITVLGREVKSFLMTEYIMPEHPITHKKFVEHCIFNGKQIFAENLQF